MLSLVFLGKLGSYTNTKKAIPLDEVLTDNGLSPGENITRIKLQRGKENYSFTLGELLQTTTDRIYLQANDRITTETLSYKENKVFILGAVNPQIFKITQQVEKH